MAHGLNVFEAEVMVLAPVEESFYRAGVRHPGVTVADGRGKEFDEVAAGALALGADDCRQRFQVRHGLGPAAVRFDQLK
jgi:hypothetical protein